jgi:hypothetical protein
LERLCLRETGYPLEIEGSFASSDRRLAEVATLALRTLMACSHETYVDCPYYEQLMYVGDARLEVLATYALSRDERLPRKALLMFDVSRRPDGLTQSRYPHFLRQIIPSFSLWWVAMVHDFAWWRDDRVFVGERMRGVRAVIDFFRQSLNDDDLVVNPPGWNYMDWVPEWSAGIPPGGGQGGITATLNWQFVWVLSQAAELEDWAREPLLAERNRQLANRVARAADAAFWDEPRGLYADDLDKQHWSEHAQCLAVLGAGAPDERKRRVMNALAEDRPIAESTIYFRHYLFETLRLMGRIDKMIERMDLWFALKKLGLKTTLEGPEPSRSDCHAWGAHPIFHYAATILGIRPAAPGFASVRIEPQLGPLTWASGRVPHPKGDIRAEIARRGDRLTGTIELPPGVKGKLVYGGTTLDLAPGKQSIP